MTPTVPESDIQSVISLVKSLLNSQLKQILREEGLHVSGVKSALQERVIDCSSRAHDCDSIIRVSVVESLLIVVK